MAIVTEEGATAPPLDVQEIALEHPHTSFPIDSRKLLMWAFLASDCMFFGMLIATYLVYKNRSIEGPYPQEVFDVPYTSVSAFVLLFSSLTMVLELAAIVLMVNIRPFAWDRFRQVFGWAFVAYAVQGGMIEYAFAKNHTPRGPMTTLTIGMVVGLYHRCGLGVLSGRPRSCWTLMTFRVPPGSAFSIVVAQSS